MQPILEAKEMAPSSAVDAAEPGLPSDRQLGRIPSPNVQGAKMGRTPGLGRGKQASSSSGLPAGKAGNPGLEEKNRAANGPAGACLRRVPEFRTGYKGMT